MRAATLKKHKSAQQPNGHQSDESPRRRGRPDPMTDLFIDVQRTADRLMQGLEDALRNTGITPVQYLVLRSLRQAGALGMPSNQIVRDMTTHDPDMTRLLDKLEEREIIARKRDRFDRRIYRVSLTRSGVRLLKNLSKITRELHRKQFNSLSKRNFNSLTTLLENLNENLISESRNSRE